MEQGNPQATPPATANAEQRLRAVQEQIQSYYSNCAMLATTPLDISLYFGKLVPITRDNGEQGLAEYYERQIIVTIEQAKKLANALQQTVQAIEAQQRPAVQRQPAPSPRPVRQEMGPKLNAALITNEADLEIEIPMGDIQDSKAHGSSAGSRAARPQLPAQAASAPRGPYHVDV
jgi:hypothetical protein